MAIYQAVNCLAAGNASNWLSWTLAALSILAGGLLIAGLLTPLSCVLLAASYLGFAFAPPTASCRPPDAALIQTFVGAIVIALLGPGAFSLDSRLFGRREIVIPD